MQPPPPARREAGPGAAGGGRLPVPTAGPAGEQLWGVGGSLQGKPVGFKPWGDPAPAGVSPRDAVGDGGGRAG